MGAVRTGIARIITASEDAVRRWKGEVRTAMQGWVGRSVAVLALACGLAGTGCGTFFIYPGSYNASSTSTGSYAYVANGTTENLAAFAIGTGTLTVISGSPYGLPFYPTAVAVVPGNAYVYVAGSSEIVGYAIGSGGALTAVSSGAALAYANAVSMDISPDGKYLIVLDGVIGLIDVYQIGSAGGLVQLPAVTYAVPINVQPVPRAIKFSPNGSLVFAALGTGGDLVYTFSGGSFAGLQTLAVTATQSENGLAVSPNGGTLYIARSGPGGGLAAYTIGTGGTLTYLGLGSGGTQPYAVAVNSAGTYVYMANRGDGTISGFNTTVSSGVLPGVLSSPYASGPSVSALTLDSSGAYLLAAAAGGAPDLTMYNFDATTAGQLDTDVKVATGASEPSGALAIATTH
jgi:6-phosphogluconolactonase